MLNIKVVTCWIQGTWNCFRHWGWNEETSVTGSLTNPGTLQTNCWVHLRNLSPWRMVSDDLYCPFHGNWYSLTEPTLSRLGVSVMDYPGHLQVKRCLPGWLKGPEDEKASKRISEGLIARRKIYWVTVSWTTVSLRPSREGSLEAPTVEE